jgi:hypothetical protein
MASENRQEQSRPRETSERSEGSNSSARDNIAQQCFANNERGFTDNLQTLNGMSGGNRNELPSNPNQPNSNSLDCPSLWNQAGESNIGNGKGKALDFAPPNYGLSQQERDTTTQRQDGEKTTQRQDGSSQKVTEFPGGKDTIEYYPLDATDGRLQVQSATRDRGNTRNSLNYAEDGTYTGRSEMKVDPQTGMEVTRKYNGNDEYTGRSEVFRNNETGETQKWNYDANDKFKSASSTRTDGDGNTRTSQFDETGRKTSEQWSSKDGNRHTDKWDADGTSSQRVEDRFGKFTETHSGPNANDNYSVEGDAKGNQVARRDLGDGRYQLRGTSESHPSDNYTAVVTPGADGGRTEQYTFDDPNKQAFNKTVEPKTRMGVQTEHYEYPSDPSKNYEHSHWDDGFSLMSSENGPTMQFRPGVSEGFQHYVKDQVDALPAADRQLLHDQSIRYDVAHKMSDIYPDAANTKLDATHGPGISEANLNGLNDPENRRIVLTETNNGAQSDPQHRQFTLFHETGHAMNEALGAKDGTGPISSTDRMVRAQQEDLSNQSRQEIISANNWQRHDANTLNNYFVQGGPERDASGNSGRHELFAQMYAEQQLQRTEEGGDRPLASSGGNSALSVSAANPHQLEVMNSELRKLRGS